MRGRHHGRRVRRGSLWECALRPDEQGPATLFIAPGGCGWHEAFDFEGSRYVGLVGRILDGLPTTAMRPNWESVTAPRGLSVPGRLHLIYIEGRCRLRFAQAATLLPFYTIADPRYGRVLCRGTSGPGVASGRTSSTRPTTRASSPRNRSEASRTAGQRWGRGGR